MAHVRPAAAASGYKAGGSSAHKGEATGVRCVLLIGQGCSWGAERASRGASCCWWTCMGRLLASSTTVSVAGQVLWGDRCYWQIDIEYKAIATKRSYP